MLAHTFEAVGHERTVVLLHSLALDRGVWERMTPLLTDRYDVLAPDLPGHGNSPATEQGTIESMADEVAALLRALELPEAFVVGLSLGGCVAQALAFRYPRMVAGLGLVDTTCWYGPTAPQDWEQRAQRVRREGFPSMADFQFSRWFTPGFRAEHPEVGQRLLEVFCRNDVDSYVATCRAMGAMDFREEIKAITAPTMIVVGAEDTATPPSYAEGLRAGIPDAQLRVLEDSSHLSPVERPEGVFEALDAGLFARVG